MFSVSDVADKSHSGVDNPVFKSTEKNLIKEERLLVFFPRLFSEKPPVPPAGSFVVILHIQYV